MFMPTEAKYPQFFDGLGSIFISTESQYIFSIHLNSSNKISKYNQSIQTVVIVNITSQRWSYCQTKMKIESLFLDNLDVYKSVDSMEEAVYKY